MKKCLAVVLIFLGLSGYSYCNDEYTVKEGDSLWYILSDKYNLTSPRKLREVISLCLEMNPSIGNPDVLLVGEKILLPENPFGKANNELLQGVLNEVKDKSPEEIDKLLSGVQDYQLVKDSLLTMVFGRYELKIRADRLLVPQNITAEGKQEYLINYIKSPSEETSSDLKDFLKEKNYVLIEIIVE